MATGDMAGAMASAPVKGSQVTNAIKGNQQQAATAPKISKNPLVGFFGEPQFSRPTRAAKWGTSKTNPNEQYATIGKVLFALGAVGTMEATIYKNRIITKTAAGRKAEESIRFSMPKGLKVTAALEEDAGRWADHVLDLWEKWDAENGGSKVQAQRAGTRSLGMVDLPEDE